MSRDRFPVAVGLLLFWLAGCGDSGTAPAGRVVAGVDLDAVFAPATSAERAGVEAEWEARPVQVEGAAVLRTEALSLGGVATTARVVAHRVDGATHYGAVVVPDDAGPGQLPVLVYAHGGDGGVSLAELQLVALGLADLADDFVYVVPSFRSEPLRFGSETWSSGGVASPWDRDVDDALGLLHVALSLTPEADGERVAVVGLSRGAGVALLMAVRDPIVDRVVEFFGPSDFFDAFVQEIVEEALQGSVRALPGVDVLTERFLLPLQAGSLSVDAFRVELVRRSAVLFADRLPAVQIHHGTDDDQVAVSQAERLVEALSARPPGAAPYQGFIYPGGGHDPLSLPGSLPRAREFLAPLTAPP